MWKAFKFCIIAAIILGITWWIANLPGELTIHAAGYQITATVPVAILLLAVLIVLVIFLTRALGGLRRSGGRVRNWNRHRRQTAGDAALQRGLVAVAAGDASSALAAASKARALLGNTALVQWIAAEAARLADRSVEARQAFERLTEAPDVQFLGYQGLLREAVQAGRWADAASLADAAETAWPGGSWTRQQRISLALRQQDYARALQLTQRAPERAALAIAAAQQAATPDLALDFAKQAVKADADQPMARATLASALRKAGKDRAARKTVLKGWQQNPTASLAEAWFEPDASPLERAQAAAQLAASNPGHPESELLLAQTALDAGLEGEARRHAETVKASGDRDGRAEAILAKLEHRVIQLQPAPWHCSACGSQQDHWVPVCPGCGKVGTIISGKN